MRRFPFVFADNVGCPLGRIFHASIKWDSGGAPWLSPMRVNETYLLVYTLEGEAWYKDTAGKDRTMEAGCLFLMPPGIAHAYAPFENGQWSEFHMWLHGPVWELWCPSTAPRQEVLFLTGLPLGYWLERFIRATAASEPQSPSASWQRIAYLQAVLADMIAANEAPGRTGSETALLRRAQEILESGLLCEPSLNDVAESVAMPYETFRKWFTAAVGISPGRYRTRHIMHRACQLLGEEHLTVKETAARLGFSDEFHFSRRFKDTIGVLPSSFRLQRRSGRG